MLFVIIIHLAQRHYDILSNIRLVLSNRIQSKETKLIRKLTECFKENTSICRMERYIDEDYIMISIN